MNVLGYLPLVERDGINVYFGDRVMIDLLDGGYIPINARTTFGGLVPFPGLQVPGLGGAIRGVGTNLFDGYIKAVNNFEVRANSQRFMNDYFKPELILYFDTGVYDNLTRKVDFNNLLSSTGAGLDFDVLGMDLILYGNYFLNEKKPSIGLALGNRF